MSSMTPATRPEITVQSIYSFDQTISRLEAAIAENKFSTVFDIDLAKRMNDKGFIRPATRILGVCSASHAHIALGDDERVIAMLPCRIAVYQKDDSVLVCTADASLLAEAYEGENLAAVAAEVNSAILRILESVTS